MAVVRLSSSMWKPAPALAGSWELEAGSFWLRRGSIGPCSRPDRSSTADTRSSRRSPKAGWAPCIAPAARCSATKSRSRSSSRIRPSRTPASASCAKAVRAPGSAIRTSSRSSTSTSSRTAIRSWSWSCSTAASLKEELAESGRFSVDDVRRIVPPLCGALQFAHGLGIVHRDLKPANIVAHEFTPGERIYKLVDFGLANIRESSVGRPADRAARVHRHDRVRLARAAVGGGRRRAVRRLQPGRGRLRDADRAGAVSRQRSVDAC